MGLFTCKSITLSIFIILTSIFTGLIYNAYNKTRFYYPDQHWALKDNMFVWSGDHPHVFIPTSPTQPLSFSHYLSSYVSQFTSTLLKHLPTTTILNYNEFDQQTSLQNAHTRKSNLDSSIPFNQEIEITTQSDFPSPHLPTHSLMDQLAYIQPWDRRTYFVQFWNYALYDAKTKHTFVLMYLYHHYPESNQRPPETHVSLAGFTPNGQLVHGANFVVESKDVYIQNETNLYYNATTHWEVRNNKTLPKRDNNDNNINQAKSNTQLLKSGLKLEENDHRWSFSHVMNPVTNDINMLGHFPSRFNCDFDHPDRINQEHDDYVELLNRLHLYSTLKQENERDYIHGDNSQINNENNKHNKNNKNNNKQQYQGKMDINGAEFEVVNTNHGNYTSNDEIDINTFIRQHTYDRFLQKTELAEKSTIHHTKTRSNYTCASMITFNFTLFPISQGFATKDVQPTGDEHFIKYGDFVNNYVEGHLLHNQTLLDEFKHRKIQDKDAFSSCKNGASFLHGYGSAAHGFLTLAPIDYIQIINNKQLYHFPPLFHKTDSIRHGYITRPNDLGNLDMNDIEYDTNGQIIIDIVKFTRDFRKEGDCSIFSQTSCITTLPQSDIHTYITTSQLDPMYDNIYKPKLHLFPNYRYALYHDVSITSLTPNTLTFWSYAPHHSVPTLRHYLLSTDQLDGPSKKSIQLLQEQIELTYPSNETKLPIHIQINRKTMYQQGFYKLMEDRKWDISNHINRFRWYAGSSYGCCLTRGVPSYRYPWAWLQVVHSFDRYDQVYVYGVPAHLDQNGTYTIEQDILDGIDNIEMKNLIIKEAARLSFNRDYTDIINAAREPSYLTRDILPGAINMYQEEIETSCQPNDKNNCHKKQLISSNHPIKYPFYNDIHIVFGDARVETYNPVTQSGYGTYSFLKIPKFPQISTRQIILRDTMSWHPSHPWNLGHNDDIIPIEDYTKSNPNTLKHEHIEHFTKDHYIPSIIPTDIEQPILEPLIYPTFRPEYNHHHDITTIQQQKQHKQQQIPQHDNFIPKMSKYMNNIPLVRSSTDGHLSLWNITNSNYFLYKDDMGSVYLPLQRTFTQETRTLWTMIQASSRGTSPQQWSSLLGFNIRAVVPMWQDIGYEKVLHAQNELRGKYNILKQFFYDIENNNNCYQKLNKSIRALLSLQQQPSENDQKQHNFTITNNEKQFLHNILTQYESKINATDGYLTLYVDIRSNARSTVIMYQKHYIPNTNCNNWYQTIGSKLIHYTGTTKQPDGQNNNNNDINNKKPIECPKVGNLQYTLWCQDYTNNQLTYDDIISHGHNDSFDTFSYQYQQKQNENNNGQNNNDNICVVYTKHLYIPTASHSLVEHAYEASIAVDMNFLLVNHAQYFQATANLRFEEELLLQIKQFYTQFQ